MRVLLLNERASERDAMATALNRTGFHIEAGGDERAAIVALMRGPAEVILIALPPKGGAGLLRKIRSADSSGQAFIIGLLDPGPTHKDIVELLGAGMNDFMRRPLVGGELLERVKAPQRLVQWARNLARPAAFSASSSVDVAGMRAWSGLGDAVAGDLAQMVGESFTVRLGWPERFGAGARCASIPMSLAGDELELRVSICVDPTTFDWIRQSLLGDANAPDASVDDVLREFANTAGGALKRTALEEQVTLTTGIPVNERLTHSADKQVWSLTLGSNGPCIAVVGEIRKKENIRVPASELREGMVLVHDLRNEGGVLLVPSGSRLTSSTAQKLARLLGPRMFLEVAPAA
jgi:CheY-like chemotaxis protein